MLARWRLILTCSLTLGALSGWVQSGTLAYFTSTATTTANQFSSGTIDISVPSSAFITLTNMVPGDRVTAQLTVTNGGTLSLPYSISSSATNADTKNLRGQLTLTIKSDVDDCSNAGFSSTGAAVYASGALLGTPLVASGATPSGGLTSGGADVLCFQIALPLASGTGYAGAATNATFTFDARNS